MTKKSIIKAAAICTLAFASTQTIAQTKTAAKPKAATAKPESPSSLSSLDLSSTGIKATIQVPAGVEIMKDEYSILIGNGKNIIMEIEETSEPFSAKVDYVKSNTVRGFSKFVQQDKNSFIALMNPFGSKMEYDFAYYVEINGTNYIIHDRGQEFHDNVKVAEMMLAIAKTIKAN
jgi:hypothetical protein